MGKRKESDIERFELAQLMLSDAEFNLYHRRFRCAISRSYYACHHAARACLDAVGQPLQKTRNTHRACISVFSRHLIKTQMLPKTLVKTLQELLKAREAVDYDLKVKNIEALARQGCIETQTFLKEAEKIC